MKMVCPDCGACFPAAAGANEAIAKECFARLAQLPPPLPWPVIGYLSLFRPQKQSLRWSRVSALLTEIQQLVECGYVSVQGKIDKGCSPAIWARAMDEMLTQRHRLDCPMQGHVYLRKVAHGLAEQADREQEAGVRAAEQTHRRPVSTALGPQIAKSRLHRVADGEIEID